MSIAQRALRGTIANLALLASHLLIQIVSVRVLLSHWGQSDYGLWIAINSLYSLFITLDVGHQTYVGSELLKDVPVDTDKAVETFWSGIVGELLLAILEVIVALALLASGQLGALAGIEDGQLSSMVLALGALLASWAACGAAGGVLLRLYQPHGDYERFIWFGVFYRTCMGVAPLLVAAGGGTVPMASMASASIAVVSVLHVLFDVRKRYPKFFVSGPRSPSVKRVLTNLVRSFVLTITSFLTQFQQHALLLILAGSLGGVGALPAFTTMRTVANVLLQAASTISTPIIPDLVRLSVTNENARLAELLGGITLLSSHAAAVLMTVGLPVVAPFYALWTDGRTTFDGPLYAMLTISVLFRVTGSGLNALFSGTNALGTLFAIAAAQASLTTAGAYFLVPLDGLRGAGLAIVCGEITGSFLVPLVALSIVHRSLAQSLGAFRTFAPWLPTLGITLILVLNAYSVLNTIQTVSLAALLLAGTGTIAWRSLPSSMRERVRSRLHR
jgi:O-antigen/teichoic acid export membrane protein